MAKAEGIGDGPVAGRVHLAKQWFIGTRRLELINENCRSSAF